MDPLSTGVAEAIRGTRATMFLATEIAWRFADVLVAKKVITSGEARATLFAIADGIRNDAHGNTSAEATEIMARYLEECGMRFAAPPKGQSPV